MDIGANLTFEEIEDLIRNLENSAINKGSFYQTNLEPNYIFQLNHNDKFFEFVIYIGMDSSPMHDKIKIVVTTDEEKIIDFANNLKRELYNLKNRIT